jgi:hypothetical protein
LGVEFSFKKYFLLEGWRNNFLIILTNLNASIYFAYGQSAHVAKPVVKRLSSSKLIWAYMNPVRAALSYFLFILLAISNTLLV